MQIGLVILTAQRFLENTALTGRITQKSLPRTPSDFCQRELVYTGLLEYGLKFSEKLFTAEENGGQ
jgi:hypothetical protein